MSIFDVTEADECAHDKAAALENLREQVLRRESAGIIDMYERAAWNAGATVSETETILNAARAASKV